MKHLIYLILIPFLFSCSSEPKDNAENVILETAEIIEQDSINKKPRTTEHEIIESFTSKLRIGKIDWNLEETFTDTLEFIEYNDEYDYPFAVFKNENRKEIQLYSEVVIKNYYTHRNYAVNWEIGKFFEAGENDAVYYQEKVIAVDQLKNSFSFEKFLKKFSKDYKKGDKTSIKKHIHPLAELVTTYKNGLYCVEGNSEFLSEISYLNETYLISSEKPKGDVCEGFKNAKDGLYYEFFDEAHDLFPRVYDMSGEGVEKMLYITEDIIYQYFVKVLVIKDGEFNRNLYFFMEQNRWFFWVADFCDCSA